MLTEAAKEKATLDQEVLIMGSIPPWAIIRIDPVYK
jgi:hypothetical protein